MENHTELWNNYVNKVTPLILNEWNKKNKLRPKNDIDILDPDIINLKYIKFLDIELEMKQKRMKYGNIHQIAIGNWIGWENLGNNHETGCDLRKTDNSVIIELKNKWNTCNSGSEKSLKEKLSLYKKSNPDTECIWGIINNKPNIKISKQIIKNNNQEIIKWQGAEFLSWCYTYNDIDYSPSVINLIKSLIHPKTL
jgi:hypothetical protein